ncbi:MAG: hypothetical protein AAGC77_10555 [Pseudomonadota bacterium]
MLWSMGMWRIALALIGIAAMLGIAPARAESSLRAANDTAAWQIRKTSWSQSDEDGYAAFVQIIGRSTCSSLEECLKSTANPLRSSVDPRLTGDCADMAYILRGYYAWKMGLPFSYQSAMRTADGAREDIRYSTAGNVVVSRRSAVGAEPVNARSYLARIGGEVSTAMFRTHPETGGGRTHDDFYPVKISRDGVRPGVIAYDIFGHVGIVYDVLEDGRILVVASHPDNSVTRTVYGPNFMRSGPQLGAGLKAWRPVWIEGAQKGADGVYRGGRLKGAQNSGLAHYSLEQYFGNAPHPSGDWAAGQFRHGDRTLEYYDFVRRRMAAPNFAYNPVDELRYGLQTICGAVKARKVAVDKAYKSRIYLKPHPNRLPPNIFGTYGEWEEYSTPSRDARLKISFIELRRELEKLVADLDAGAPSVRYDGDDLAGDLLAAFDEEKAACAFVYTRSDATRVLMNLGHVADRLFDLSFDPYHCPERRWGARGAELETCADDALKSQWYNAQRFLRYQAERTYDVRMDFTLSELQPPMIAPPEQGGLGVEAPADADIRGYIETLLEPNAANTAPSLDIRVRFSPDTGI